jgi:hypothetical protein
MDSDVLQLVFALLALTLPFAVAWCIVWLAVRPASRRGRP